MKKLILFVIGTLLTIVTACVPISLANNPLVGTWDLSLNGNRLFKVAFSADGNVYVSQAGSGGGIIQGTYGFSDKEIKARFDQEVEIVMLKTSSTAEIPDPSQVSTLKDQRNKAIQSEARAFISNYLKAQQVYYNENNKFAENFQQLALGLRAETDYFTFASQVSQSDPTKAVAIVTATPKDSQLKAASGIVSLGTTTDGGVTRATLYTQSCINQQAGTPPVIPIRKNDIGEVMCGEGSEPFK